MTLWFTEHHEEGCGLTLQIKDCVFSVQTDYQKLEILDTVSHGRMMVLDGCVMITDRDEFVYHEMITHPALCSMDSPRRALVVGGGDGGAVREILRHSTIEKVVLAEIDGAVVEASRRFFPQVACGLDDPRVQISIGDGIQFLKETDERFDLICVDSTDPVGPAVGLFQPEFYSLVAGRLTDQGVMAAQMESPFFHSDLIRSTLREMKRIFKWVDLGIGFVHTYPAGFWCWAYASAHTSVESHFKPDLALAIESECRYYAAELHPGAFRLPRFVRELVAER